MAEKKAEIIIVGDASSVVRASAEAKAALKSLQDQANNTKLDKFSSGVSKLDGALGGLKVTAMAGAAPAVAGLTGAIGGLAASAAAAVGGAGALGVGGIGALTTGLGSIALVAKPAVTHFGNVTKALDAYTKSVDEYGAKSKQAATAQKALNAVVAQNGGKQVLDAAKAWDALGNSFQKLTGPATSSMFKGFNDALATMKSDLPTVAAIANKSMASLVTALQGPLKMLGGKQFQGYLTDLGNTFSKMIGPAVDAASKVFLAFTRIAVSAGPYVVQFTKGIDDMATKFANATGNTGKLNSVVGILVSNFKSWMSLIGAVGRLVFDVFKHGVSSGQSMVDSLTGVVNKWDAWVRSAGGSAAITNFFQESAQFARELFTALGPVVQSITTLSVGPLPVYVKLMGLLKPIMGPLTYAFVAFRGAVLAANSALKVTAALESLTGVAGKSAGKSALVLPGGGGAGLGVETAASSRTLGSRFADAQDLYAIERSAGYGIGTSLKVGLKSSGIADVIRSGLGTALTRGSQGLLVGTLGVGLSQVIGTAIHGAIGQAAKTIGSDVSIGAGFGSLFGPAGMAGGAIVGGLVGTFQHFISSDAGWQGKQFADKFLAPMPAAVRAKYSDAVARAKQNVVNAQQGTPHITFAGRGGALGGGGAPVSRAVDTAAEARQYFNEGWKLGTVLIAGLQSVKSPTEFILLKDFKSQLAAMNPQARDEAAAVMVTYAQTLQKEGRLPKGSVDSLIKSLEDSFPGLQAYLLKAGKADADTIAKAMKMTQADSNWKAALLGFRTQYQDWSIDQNITSKNIVSNTKQAMADLQVLMTTGPKSQREAAEREYNTLKQNVSNTFAAMASDLASKQADMTKSIKDGSKQSAQAAAANYTQFAKSVQGAMAAGVLATSQGMQMIAQATNATIKAFGGRTIPIPALVHAQQITSLFSQGKTGVAGVLSAGAQGMRVETPQYIVGEEAPQHPEYVLATNPAYRKRNLGLWAEAGKKLGVPGFASGGVIGYSGLEGLWDQAGGNRSMAPLMAAIAEAESGGNPSAYNASGASGLWQILGLPFPGNVFDPLTNARMAVSKFMSQGLGAWVTYTSGAYKRYLNGNVAPSMGLGSITAPGVRGTGAIATLLRAVLGRAAGAANAFVQRLMPSGGGGGSIIGASGGGFSPSQLGAFDGMSVARWIIPELAWARAHGWGGHVTSGYRPPNEVVHGVFATAPQGKSEHRLDIYPGGAVDVSDYGQFASIIRGYPGSQKLIQLPSDPLHFSGTGHARGGIIGGPFVGSFARGGRIPRTGLALVHQGEMVVPGFKTGGVPRVGNTHSSYKRTWSKATATNDPVAAALASVAGSLYPVDQELAVLADLLTRAQAQTPSNHNAEIAKLESDLKTLSYNKTQGLLHLGQGKTFALSHLSAEDQALRAEAMGLPVPAAGKAGHAQRLANAKALKEIDKQRLDIAKQRAAVEGTGSSSRTAIELQYNKQRYEIEQKIAALKGEDKAAKNNLAIEIKEIGVKEKQLSQLKAYKDAVASLYDQIKSLAGQAAQAWNTAQHNAINNGPLAKQLAAMKSQDAATQNAEQLATLNKNISDAQFLVAHSAGQTHVDALAQLQQAQQALTDFQRQQTEQSLQDQIDAQNTAVDNQTQTYQNGLEAQLTALTDNLNQRKLTYAQWAQDVNGILAQYGLSVQTDPSSETTIDKGPGTTTVISAKHVVQKFTHHAKHFHAKHHAKKFHRAMGGPVEPGYVYTVGENGPEDVAFGQRGVVMSASQTRRNRDGGPIVHIEHFHSHSAHEARRFAEKLAFRAAIGTA